MASAMKYQPDIIAPGRLAYMYGVSQTGRALRQIIYEGFTIDEQGRKVFDAAFIKTGGASIGPLQRALRAGELARRLHRDAVSVPVPDDDGSGDWQARRPGRAHPGRSRAEDLHLRHRFRVLGQGTARGAAPRVGGRHRRSARRANVRVYYVAGSRHGSGSVPAADGGGQFKSNPLDYSWAERALMEALDAWVREGKEPPESRHPRFADGTMVHHHQLDVPGRARRALADQRARRLSLGRGHDGLADAVPALAGGCRRQRDRRHPPAGAGGRRSAR